MSKKKLQEERQQTPLQAQFVRWYTTLGPTLFNATESCAAAGYKGSRRILANQGYANVRLPHIHAAIRASINEQFGAADLSIEKVLQDIEMNRVAAMRVGDYSTALRCSVQHGKYLKMWIDKVEHIHTIDDVSLEDLITLANRLAEKVDGIYFNGGAGGNGSAGGAADGDAGDRTTH